MGKMGLTGRDNFLSRYLAPAVKSGFVLSGQTPVSPPEISAHGKGRGFVLQAMTVPGTVMIAAQAGCRFVCRESGIVECLRVVA